MSVPLRPNDPAQILKRDSYFTTPIVYDEKCYICTDHEFAEMGLPLCRVCKSCQEFKRGSGHIPADDTICTMCGYDETIEELTDDQQRFMILLDEKLRLIQS